MTKSKDKPIGLTKDTGWQIGVRHTIAVNVKYAWDVITSIEGLKIWLCGDSEFDPPTNKPLNKGQSYRLKDGTTGTMRVLKPYSHLRITWHPVDWPRASTIQVRVLNNQDKSVIVFHQEHMPGPQERENRREFYQCASKKLKVLLNIK